MKFEMFSFPTDWTEEQKLEVYNELNAHYDKIEKDYEQFLEDENEAREVYRSITSF